MISPGSSSLLLLLSVIRGQFDRRRTKCAQKISRSSSFALPEACVSGCKIGRMPSQWAEIGLSTISVDNVVDEPLKTPWNPLFLTFLSHWALFVQKRNNHEKQ